MIKAEKIILPVLKHFVLLQRSYIQSGIETAGRTVSIFYALTYRVSLMAWWYEVAVTPSRISFVVLNSTSKPFFVERSKNTKQ